MDEPRSDERATETGAPVVPGKVYVNNGFWDTYRTIWSAYSLLYPKDAGELVDGFVQHYRDGGWLHGTAGMAIGIVMAPHWSGMSVET